jgi:hypothetical protein
VPPLHVVESMPTSLLVSSIRREANSVVVHVYEATGRQVVEGRLRVGGVNTSASALRQRVVGAQPKALQVCDGWICLGPFSAFEVTIVRIQLA